MNLMLLTRAATSIALPTALGLAWIQRRNDRPAAVEQSARPGPRSERRRPTRRELRRMIANGDPLCDLDLRSHRLKGAQLRQRDLARSDLTKVDLRDADLVGADLSETVLDFADLSGADLGGADMKGASLVETSLWNSDLCGADLRGVRNLVMANLKRASFDPETVWPGRFDPTTLGAVPARKRRH
jgi:uncharacterized protein YjbI with pentapeptide repeats